MPKRTDIKKILLLGSGPIVIGQACEFDYSGTQACKALREEGFEIVLVNSNPATIMTDPEFSDQTYIEPLTPEYVEYIIEKERPDAILRFAQSASRPCAWRFSWSLPQRRPRLGRPRSRARSLFSICALQPEAQSDGEGCAGLQFGGVSPLLYACHGRGGKDDARLSRHRRS